MAQELTFSITEFHGLSDPNKFGRDPTVTRDMDNVVAEFGRIVGRDGYAALDNAQTGEVIGLFDLENRDAVPTLVRFDTDDIYELASGAWSSISALTQSSDGADDIAQAAMFNDSLYMITANEQLIKWTGSGNVTQNTNSPGASTIEAFEGFLVLGDAKSDNTASAPGNDRIRWEDATGVDGTWDTTQTAVLDQTNGVIRRLKRLGRVLYAYKSDGLVALRFIGGDTVFQIEQVPFSHGILAKSSVGEVPGLGHIFLASDGRLYLNTGQVQPILAKVNNKLVDDLNFARAPFAFAVVDLRKEIYRLFYPSGSNNYCDKRLDFNYTTGSYSIQTYTGALFTRGVYSGYNASNSTEITQDLIVGNEDSETFTVESGSDDDGNAIERVWTSDWQDFGFPGEKFLNRIDVTLKEDARSAIEISVRSDFERQYSQTQLYGVSSMKTDGDIIVKHGLKPVLGKWHDVRIRLKPGNLGSTQEIRRVDFFYTPASTKGQRSTPTNIKGI